MASIAELLAAARRRSFVGREKELELFEGQLLAPALSFVLLYIFGAGGEGKTTLLKQYAELCNQHQIRSFTLDAREIEAHPAAFLDAARHCLGQHLHPDQDIFEAFAQLEGRCILFIDTYEKISPIDDWMRTDFLARLPVSCLTVICSRHAPSISWMNDAGWKILMRSMHLRSFSPAESEEDLRRRHIPEDKINPVLDFTHGHPLALSMVAELL